MQRNYVDGGRRVVAWIFLGAAFVFAMIAQWIDPDLEPRDYWVVRTQRGDTLR